mgnify:CR=1 FL=1
MKNVGLKISQRSAKVYYDLIEYDGVAQYQHKFKSEILHQLFLDSLTEFKVTYDE